MSLIQVKRYLMQARQATLTSLCTLFQAEPETMRCLLNHLVRKGCVRQCQRAPACGSSCFKCPVASTEVYEWVLT
jgi:putative ferrous iron transport protein C